MWGNSFCHVWIKLAISRRFQLDIYIAFGVESDSAVTNTKNRQGIKKTCITEIAKKAFTPFIRFRFPDLWSGGGIDTVFGGESVFAYETLNTINHQKHFVFPNYI